MITLAAIRTTLIPLLVFSHSVFADKGPVSNAKKKMKPYVLIEKDTNKAGMARTKIENHGSEWGNDSYLTMIHDRKGKLKYFLYKIMRRNQAVLEVNNGTTSIIINGKTPCDVLVAEPFGDTISFDIKHTMIPIESPQEKSNRDFLNSKIPAIYKYDNILFSRWEQFCQFYRGFDVFFPHVFTDWGPPSTAHEHLKPYVNIERDTNDAGMITTRITDNHRLGDFSYLVMMHDSKGYLKYYIYYIVKNNLIVQEVNNDVLRTVISGKTPCDFAVVESSGDTVLFNLDPAKKPNEIPEAKTGQDFVNSKMPMKYGYEMILSNRWHTGCKFWR